MMQVNLRKAAIATAAATCAMLLSFDWSENRGVSLSIDSATLSPSCSTFIFGASVGPAITISLPFQ